jgi:hypothetical protein
MNRRAAGAALALFVFWSSPSLARDPFADEPLSERDVPRRYPDPAPFIAPPPGVYYVTDTYVADVVTSTGPLTTYTTTTVHESTGSYARVLDTVGTGVASAYDGRAFNGRRALGDGRLVAGTYYENFVLTDGVFVPISIVFFQDDAELARLSSAPTPRPTDTAPPSPVPATATPSVPGCCAAERRATTAAATPAPTKPVWPGISLLPVSAPLASVEVLRGRGVALWPRAFVDGREVPIRSWAVVSGEAGQAASLSGSGAVPFRTSWTRLAPPGAAYNVLFRIEVDTPETGYRAVHGAIAVVVRSPALQD